MTEAQAVDVETILKLLPHRYPFLLVDRVLEYSFDSPASIHAIKNVTINEPFFQGHFPDHPVMPGVLILEAMAQAAGCLAHLARIDSGAPEQLFYLVKIDKARFTKPVVPGDQLHFHVIQKRLMRGMGQYRAETRVDGRVVASCEMLCAARPESK
ncbi:MAG: 3-hydroxyacyl-[acyl-carrier-protein] dehydratase FabZ [Gammaproteobacteria bacterium HGW-Gammaproteobacteria-8]|nr:MAG: 3-hydroxyacyl-[acyl-carrier-protein] dehydratase FabZ [Gammaproteobacteria bacterium HGW-Gammaproteobacteria-8]